MWKLRYFTYIFLALFAVANTQADTVTEETTTVTTPADAPTITTPAPSPSQVSGRPMIVTPVPSAKEEIATPTGYVNCFTVEAGWYKNAWVPEHRICQYEAQAGQTVTYEGVAWIESYWACTQYTDATCTKWEWKPGHWVKTLEVY
jgi:hypothetical protein